MIQKLRRKFVLALMGVVTVLLGALLLGLYISSAAHYRQAALETLRSSLLEGGRARGSMPVIVAEVDPAGRVRILFNPVNFMTGEEVLEAIAEAGGAGTETGDLPARNLRYLRRAFGPGMTRYAFADTYGEKASLRAQAASSLIIGAAALIGFLAFSIVLSRWMVRPVEAAWAKQRQFVADASHELKTPLTVALSNVDMALTAAIRDGKNRRRLEITKIELLRMKDLVEKLLTLARADAEGVQTPSKPFAPVDFSYLLECGVSSFEPVYFEAGRQLKSEILPGCRVAGDAEKLSELLSILLDNACKYSGSGVLVRLGREGGKWIHLTVENDGASIPKGDLSRIFDRFYRVDASRGEAGGYGLGLSIAQAIVVQHKGKIRVESGEGRTVFHVLLPAASARAE